MIYQQISFLLFVLSCPFLNLATNYNIELFVKVIANRDIYIYIYIDIYIYRYIYRQIYAHIFRRNSFVCALCFYR